MTLGFFGPATLSRSQAILQSTTCSKPHDDSPPRMIARLRGLGNRYTPTPSPQTPDPIDLGNTNRADKIMGFERPGCCDTRLLPTSIRFVVERGIAVAQADRCAKNAQRVRFAVRQRGQLGPYSTSLTP